MENSFSPSRSLPFINTKVPSSHQPPANVTMVIYEFLDAWKVVGNLCALQTEYQKRICDRLSRMRTLNFLLRSQFFFRYGIKDRQAE